MPPHWCPRDQRGELDRRHPPRGEAVRRNVRADRSADRSSSGADRRAHRRRAARHRSRPRHHAMTKVLFVGPTPEAVLLPGVRAVQRECVVHLAGKMSAGRCVRRCQRIGQTPHQLSLDGDNQRGGNALLTEPVVDATQDVRDDAVSRITGLDTPVRAPRLEVWERADRYRLEPSRSESVKR